MKSNSNFTCDFCSNREIAFDYKPVNSLRGNRVVVCSLCGLTQSISSVAKIERKQTLSCDADWGNVRHAKGIRLKVLSSTIEKALSSSKKMVILDVGSNRGDFVHWCTKKFPLAEIIAIEPDPTIVSDYQDLKNVHLFIEKLENSSIDEVSIDIAYCSHTLEHAASATEMLRHIRKLLRPNGLLFLEVPNLKGITYPNVVEEFFIDKHVYHFDKVTLVDQVQRIGFEIDMIEEGADDLNITLVLRKSEKNLHLPFKTNTVVNNEAMLKYYFKLLSDNRDLLRILVEKKLLPLSMRQKVAYWGAGRIFDALIKYGRLPADSVYALIDTYLWNIVPEAYGIAIQRPENLRMIEPDICIVLARSSKDEIGARAYRFGIRHIIFFDEIMDQCRMNL